LKILELGEIGISSATNLMTGVGKLEVQFWALKLDGSIEKAIQSTLSQTKFGFTATTEDMDISVHIENF